MKNVASDQQSIERPPISFGVSTIDAALGGGLVGAGLHEIYASQTAYFGGVTGFAAALVLKAAGTRPIVWVRQDFLDVETGFLNASGIAEIGLDPSRIILVRARDAKGALRAGEQAARCAALGVVVIQPWGDSSVLNFTASRRLSLASAQSGVPVLMLRQAASPSQSAATSRWRIQAKPSRALEARAPGFPAFELTLLRRRGGAAGQVWHVEWDRDGGCFQDCQPRDNAQVSRTMVSLSHNGQTAPPAPRHEWRRAG